MVITAALALTEPPFAPIRDRRGNRGPGELHEAVLRPPAVARTAADITASPAICHRRLRRLIDRRGRQVRCVCQAKSRNRQSRSREKSCFHDPPPQKNASQAEVSTLPRRAAISVSSGTQTFMPLRHNIGSGIAATGHFPPIDDVSATSAFALIAPLRPMNRHKRGADL